MLKKETIYVIYKETIVSFRGIIDRVMLAKDFNLPCSVEKIKEGMKSIENSFNLHLKSNKVYPAIELEEDEYNKLKEEK